MKTAKIRAIALFVFVFSAVLTAPIFAETETQAKKQRAIAALQAGRAIEAYDIYFALTLNGEDDDETKLGFARAAAKAGKLHQAVFAYERLLERFPRRTEFYGELAEVYSRLGDKEAADRSRIMSAGNAGGFQKRGAVRAGVLYDSNANSGADSDEFNLGGYEIALKDAKAVPSAGVYLGANVDLSYPIGGEWRAIGGADAFAKYHFASELADLKIQESLWGRGAIGARHLGAAALSELKFKAEIFDYEFDRNVKSYGAEAVFLWAARRDWHLILRGAIDERSYSDDKLKDGGYGAIEVYSRLFLGELNDELTAGAKYFFGDADYKNYDFAGYEVSLRFLLKFSNGFEVAPFAAFAAEKYKGAATFFESEDRKDDRLRAGVSGLYRLDKSWSIEGNLQYTKNGSNSELYENKQASISAGALWEF